ncbi:MAG: superoxide dismutase [Paracoccus sp. (in: a-proteobacteria)]|nr:superoxide dismutase [Paracoccus sp. (in: a-proteobacteria)]
MKQILTLAAILALPSAALAEFSLPDLPYPPDALSPVIEAETMELHHGRHHQSYVDNLNKAIAEGDAPAEMSLEELVATAGMHGERVRNNAGGHWNHSFFWNLMAPADQTGEMSQELAAAINDVWGSEDDFRKAFQDAGAGRFGSGWVWLIVNNEDQLEITTTPNQDNPLMDVAERQGTPILGNDVWEHAYYLDYRNRRADYLESWWDVVNWDRVSELYAEALAD